MLTQMTRTAQARTHMKEAMNKGYLEIRQELEYPRV
jgi:hypothetical protein